MVMKFECFYTNTIIESKKGTKNYRIIFLVPSHFNNNIVHGICTIVCNNYKLLYILAVEIPNTRHSISTIIKSINAIRYAQKNERA